MLSKVKIIKIYLNIYFIGLPLYSEEKLYSSTSLIFKYCIAYRSHPASRRNVRTYSGTRRGLFFWSPGQLCWINWNSEPQFGRPKVHWFYRHYYRQAPVHNPIISNYATYYYYLFVHLSYWNWMKILDA